MMRMTEITIGMAGEASRYAMSGEKILQHSEHGQLKTGTDTT